MEFKAKLCSVSLTRDEVLCFAGKRAKLRFELHHYIKRTTHFGAIPDFLNLVAVKNPLFSNFCYPIFKTFWISKL
jgi:hypothetical protein